MKSRNAAPPRYSALEVDFALRRDSPFSYRCNACKRCCHGKAIRVGPWEILRLARLLGITTTRFIAEHTEAGGTILRTQDTDDGACIFLNDRGCGVHAERPIACRIYPLGSRIEVDGRETFGLIDGHPLTEGVYGDDGTVADFLGQQGLAPAFAAVAQYRKVYDRMAERLAVLDARERDEMEERQSDVIEMEAGASGSPWIDIDKTVAEYCAARGLPIPDDIDGAVDRHIEALDDWIAALGG